MRVIHSRTAAMAFCEVYPFQNSLGGVLWGLSIPEQGGTAFCEMYPFQNRGGVMWDSSIPEQGGGACGQGPQLSWEKPWVQERKVSCASVLSGLRLWSIS